MACLPERSCLAGGPTLLSTGLRREFFKGKRRFPDFCWRSFGSDFLASLLDAILVSSNLWSPICLSALRVWLLFGKSPFFLFLFLFLSFWVPPPGLFGWEAFFSSPSPPF